MGIPTVNGGVVFDDRSWQPAGVCRYRRADPGRHGTQAGQPADLIVAVGGGPAGTASTWATFSSLELSDQS